MDTVAMAIPIVGNEATNDCICEICGREHTFDDLRPEIQRSIIDAHNGIGLSPAFDTAEEATAWALAQPWDDDDIWP